MGLWSTCVCAAIAAWPALAPIAPPPSAPGTATPPQPTAPRKIDLRPKLAVGDTHRFDMTIDTLLHLKAPQAAEENGDDGAGGAAGPQAPAEQKQSAKQWVDFIIRVREASPEGATLEVEYAGLRFSLDSPNQSGSFDSAHPVAAEEPGDISAEAALRPVVGTKLTVRLDASGNVTEVTGGDQLAPQEGAAPEAAGAFWPRVASQFRERAIVASFIEPILTTRNPRGEAAVGETWTYEDRLEDSPLGSFTIITSYKLEAVAGASAVIALSGRITAEPPAGEGRPPFELRDSTNVGRAVWNTDAGVLDSLDQTQSVELRTTMQGVNMDLINRTSVRITRTK